MSHAELHEALELDAGDPETRGRDCAAAKPSLEALERRRRVWRHGSSARRSEGIDVAFRDPSRGLTIRSAAPMAPCRRRRSPNTGGPVLALITLAVSVPTAASAAATGTLIGAGIDWELAFKALGLLATIAGSVIQLRNFKLSSHAGLKTELEILKLLDESDAHYKTVKKSVDLRVARLYAVHDGASAKLSIERIVLFVFGAAWALGFAYWTIQLSSPVFSWWSLATGYAVLLGLVWLGMGVTGKGLSHRKASAQQGASGTEAQSPDAESSRTDA